MAPFACRIPPRNARKGINLVSQEAAPCRASQSLLVQLLNAAGAGRYSGAGESSWLPPNATQSTILPTLVRSNFCESIRGKRAPGISQQGDLFWISVAVLVSISKVGVWMLPAAARRLRLLGDIRAAEDKLSKTHVTASEFGRKCVPRVP